LDKFPLYAAMGVPEVWRYQDGVLEIWVLEGKEYVRRHSSRTLPLLTSKLISEFLEARVAMTRPAWLRQTRERIRALIKAQAE
jgi:Uma2 family endonuclease